MNSERKLDHRAKLEALSQEGSSVLTTVHPEKIVRLVARVSCLFDRVPLARRLYRRFSGAQGLGPDLLALARILGIPGSRNDRNGAVPFAMQNAGSMRT